VSGVETLQRSDLAPDAEASARASLSLRTQLVRLPLMIVTHLGGLTVGTESPSAALGASILTALRDRIPPLRRIPLGLTAAIGGGAGLAAAFRSPLLGTSYAIAVLAPKGGHALVLPCLLVGAVGALLNTGLGLPAHGLDVTTGGLPPALWPRAVAVALLCIAVGAGFSRALRGARSLVARAQGRPVLAAAAVSACLAGLAFWSGGVSLNDGQLVLSPLIGGSGRVDPWLVLPRFVASALSVAIGAPGGIMHDSMTMGAILSTPFTSGLVPGASSVIAALGAVTFFSAVFRTPLFCAIFVFQLQADPVMLLPLLLFAALATSSAELIDERFGSA
jgi:H+/Cl- antiporter ClcA